MVDVPRLPCGRCGGEMRLVDGTTDAFRCIACGSTSAVAMVRVSASPEVDPDEIAKRQRQIDRARRTHELALLDALAFSVFGLEGDWTGSRSIAGVTDEVRAAIDHVRPQDHWDAASVIVDEPLDARVFRVGISWVAAIGLDGSDLVVTSRGLPVDDVALATVHDFAPYLAGA